MNVSLAKIKLAFGDQQAGPLVRILNQPLPGLLSYRLAKITNAARPHLEAAETARVNLIKQHGVEGEGGAWEVGAEALPTFAAEYDAVLAQEVEIDCAPITIDEIGARVELSAVDFLHLDWLIVDKA